VTAEEHKAKSVKAVRCFVVTVSDTRNVSTDQSGQLIKDLLTSGGHEVLGYRIVKDDPTEVENLLRQVLSHGDLDAILLTGGTGISPRDGTYEVVSCLLDKQISGFGEIFRFLSYQDIGSSAVMSRAQSLGSQSAHSASRSKALRLRKPLSSRSGLFSSAPQWQNGMPQRPRADG